MARVIISEKVDSQSFDYFVLNDLLGPMNNKFSS